MLIITAGVLPAGLLNGVTAAGFHATDHCMEGRYSIDYNYALASISKTPLPVYAYDCILWPN